MSTIAIDIKRMMERKVKCPVKTPKSAIQLLLEIGVEKIRRDYVTLFLSMSNLIIFCTYIFKVIRFLNKWYAVFIKYFGFDQCCYYAFGMLINSVNVNFLKTNLLF